MCSQRSFSLVYNYCVGCLLIKKILWRLWSCHYYCFCLCLSCLLFLPVRTVYHHCCCYLQGSHASWFKWKTSGRSVSPSFCWLLLTCGILTNFAIGVHMHCIQVLQLQSKCHFFFIFKHLWAQQVLENYLCGSWKSRGFFVSKRVGTPYLLPLLLSVFLYWYNSRWHWSAQKWTYTNCWLRTSYRSYACLFLHCANKQHQTGTGKNNVLDVPNCMLYIRVSNMRVMWRVKTGAACDGLLGQAKFNNKYQLLCSFVATVKIPLFLTYFDSAVMLFK